MSVLILDHLQQQIVPLQVFGSMCFQCGLTNLLTVSFNAFTSFWLRQRPHPPWARIFCVLVLRTGIYWVSLKTWLYYVLWMVLAVMDSFDALKPWFICNTLGEAQAHSDWTDRVFWNCVPPSELLVCFSTCPTLTPRWCWYHETRLKPSLCFFRGFIGICSAIMVPLKVKK